MTVKEIMSFIEKRERELWDSANESQEMYGRDSELTDNRYNAWGAVYDLLQDIQKEMEKVQ